MRKNKSIKASFIFGAFFLTGLIIGILIGWKRGIPFLMKQGQYSIGIYSGTTPFSLTSNKNPVLTAKNIDDIDARFVADPFMINNNQSWFMFFEVYNERTQQGDIGLAKSEDGYSWKYQKIVIDAPYHLSYPFVFKDKNTFYMIPETSSIYSVNLYKAIEFPQKWQFVKTIIKGNYRDSTILFYDGYWWVFTSDRDDMLHIFYSKELLGKWYPHPQNPVVYRQKSKARSCGRIIMFKNKIYRFSQDCEKIYGHQVRSFEITELTQNSYREIEVRENPVLSPGKTGWNSGSMHHIDLHQLKSGSWIACVDGSTKKIKLGLKY